MRYLAAALFVGQMWAQSARPYMITTVAGRGRATFAENTSPLSVQFYQPERVAEDFWGNLYISDSYYHRVFKIPPGGVAVTFAGTGEPGYNGDGIAANKAQLNCPAGVRSDSSGNVYIADSCNHRIRKVSLDGIISTVAGTGEAGYAGDRGPAVKATLDSPAEVAVDAAGSLYIADSGNHAVRKVDGSGIISTIAGTGTAGAAGDGGPAAAARLYWPGGIAFDTYGNLYIADSGNHILRKVAASNGVITTVAGLRAPGYGGDGGRAAAAALNDPQALAIDVRNNIYIADTGNSRVRKIAPDGTITTAAGTGEWGASGDGGECTKAQLGAPTGLAIDDRLNLYIADYGERRIRRLFTGTISTVAGSGLPRQIGDNAQARSALLLAPAGIAFDPAGNLYIADRDDNRVRKIAPNGVITTLAGTGSYAVLPAPRSVALDSAGNVYIAAAYRVWKVDKAGTLAAFAGTGEPGDSGDGGAALQARLGAVLHVAVDFAGYVYISDAEHHRVRKISPAGVIGTILGSGSPGPLNSPAGLTLDSKANLFIADEGNHRVQRVGFDGVIRTVAGTGVFGSDGDGGPALDAKLASPAAVAVDAAGNLYIADWWTSSIRRVGPDGVIKTVAGIGEDGFSGDGGNAAEARLNGPEALAVDAQGILHAADSGNMRVRRIEQVQIFINSVVNAASFAGGAVAPGEIVTIFGVEFGPPSLARLSLNPAGNVDTRLANTRVLFGSVAAPLLYAVDGQVSAIVPYGVRTSTTVAVEYQGKSTNVVTLPVVASLPAIFTSTSSGTGQGAILNQDNTLNSAANPAARGSVVVLYATGEGQTSPAGADGRISRLPTLPKPALTVAATVDGLPAEILYAGAAPNMVAGVMQVNVRIPAGARPGAAVPIAIVVGSAASQAGVTVAVK